MSVFLHDDFTGSGAIGAPNWGNAAGGFFGGDISYFSQSGGFLTVNTANKDGAANFVGTVPSADYYAEAQCVGTNTVRIGVRADYYVEVVYVDATHISTQVIESSLSVQLDGSVAVTRAVANGASVDVRLEIQGSTLRLKLDGTQVWTGTNSTVSAVGWPFIDIPRSGASYSSLDWFEAGTLGGTPFWTDYVKSREIDA